MSAGGARPDGGCLLCGETTRGGRLCRACAAREYANLSLAHLGGIGLGVFVAEMSMVGIHAWNFDPLRASFIAASGLAFSVLSVLGWRKASRSRMYADRHWTE